MPWCRGAWCCLTPFLALVPPSLALPLGVVLAVACGCAPFPARVPRSAAGYPSSSFCVAAFFTLLSTLRWSALLPGVHFPLPHLPPCVCFGMLRCLLPHFLGPLLPLILDPARQTKGGGVGCLGGGGLDDDMRTSLAVVVVCIVAAAVPPRVACACVAVSWFFSIPLVRRWRHIREWRAWHLVVWSHGERVRCCCRCLWAAGIPLALLVCARLFAVACTHTMHSSFRGVGGLFVRCLLLPASVHCCGILPCRVWQGRGSQFSCVCVRGVGGVSLIPSLPCSIPSHPRLSAPFLLFHTRAVLSLAAALFSIPRGVWLPPCFCARAFFSRFLLPSSPFIPFCFLTASPVCMYSVALHTLLCLRRLACVCKVWAYLSLPMQVGRACSLGYTSSVTLSVSAVLAASSCVSFTPPRSRCDLLWARAL